LTAGEYPPTLILPARSRFLNSSSPILAQGLAALRQSDADIERLIAPRHDEVLSLLEKYIAEIELFNPAYGLVGTDDRKELIIRHLFDSLAPLGIISRLLTSASRTVDADSMSDNVPKIADVGSGAGLPGIPLAIALPHISVTLIERMGKRAGFLRNACAALASSLASPAAASNIAVEEMEMETAAPNRFALVTFRAFKPLEPKLLKSLFRLCAEGGILAAYKGRRAKIEEEMIPLAALCGSWEAIPCPVPLLDEERHLLVIKKGGPD
jgi:16S rRNA (guanine527-N7)-methyltransferase